MKSQIFLAGIVAAILSAGCCSNIFHGSAKNSGETAVAETQVVHATPATKEVESPLPTTIYYYGYAHPTGPTLTKVTTVTTVNGPMEEEAYYTTVVPNTGEVYVGGTTALYGTSTGAGSSTGASPTTGQGQVPPTQNNPVHHGAGLYYDKFYFDN